MEEFLDDFTSQLENFQKAFKSKSFTSNHLLWAEAEESRLLETLTQISKQNQSLQSQIDHLLSNSSPKTKPKHSALKSEIISLSSSISSLSGELLQINSELKNKDEVISSLTSKLEILNPPDLGTIGLPSEWKYLEGKQIEYEIISPRFLNDSDDSLKDLNEVTVFSPSNKEKRNNCKSLDLQKNFGFESEDFRKVYGKNKALEGFEKKWDKEVVVEEYKIGDEDELDDEKVIQNKNLIIDYAEEVSEKGKGDTFEVVESYPGWGTEVPEVDLEVEAEKKQFELVDEILFKEENELTTENFQHKVEKFELINEVTQHNLEKEKPITQSLQQEEEEKDELITEVNYHNKVNEVFKAETNTVEAFFNKEKSFKIEASGFETNVSEEKTILEQKSDLVIDPTSNSVHQVQEIIKVQVQSDEESRQKNEHSAEEEEGKKTTYAEPNAKEDQIQTSEELRQKNQAMAEETKKEFHSEPKVKEPVEPPVKKFFTKYQPKVIPKKLQVKKAQNDEFFNELL